MKHKVKKEMFELTVNGKTIRMTEDHSLMVRRDNKIVDIKSTD
jgi:intein/homing endonuclease